MSFTSYHYTGHANIYAINIYGMKFLSLGLFSSILDNLNLA